MSTEKRLRRCYRRIEKLEQQIDPKVAIKLRASFDADTARFIANHQKSLGWTRGQRRQFKRDVVKSA